ncbi:hypothetical protein NOD94_005205 [Streptomyces sp. Isolate_45]|nr:DUF6545 domain-containing protein [Streptomyces sp. Isolate_45]MDA5279970.1 hypothetical protein [Streptomyces sp. Isolate_45]
MLQAVMAYLVTATCLFVFGSIPMLMRVNDLTGTPNFAAPLLYSILMACTGSGIVLIINWRGGPPDRIRRATSWCMGAYAAVSVALFALFMLGEAPVERLEDFDTYYATTPYVREMIALYLAAHTTSVLVMVHLCRRWLHSVKGELRVGLALMVTGYALAVAFDLCKFAAVGARWAGLNWDVLSTDLARPLAAASAPFVAFGFGIPYVVQRLRKPWREWTRYRQLGPLARLLRGLAPTASTIRMPLFSSAGVRRLQLESIIHDGLLTLNPYFDLTLRARSIADALTRGVAPEAADAAADAAMIVAAVEALRADPERQVITTSQGLQEGAGEDRDLVRISQSLSSIPAAGRPNTTREPA